MQVRLKMDEVTIQLGNRGINLAIADPKGKHIGDLRIGRGAIVWMRGKTTEKNGKRLTMAKFLQMLEDA